MSVSILFAVATATVGSSTVAIDDRVPNRALENWQPSSGAQLADQLATELRANTFDDRRAELDFSKLSLVEQRSFLREWEREVKPTTDSQRVLQDIRRLYTARVERANRNRASQIVGARPPPKPETGLKAVEVVAGAGTLLLWRLVMGGIIASSDIGSGGAAGLLLVDALVAVLAVPGVQWAVANQSEYWKASYGGAVLGAGIIHGVLLLVTVAVVTSGTQNHQGELDIKPGFLVLLGIASIVGPPIGAAFGSTSSESKRRRVAIADPFAPDRTGRRAPSFGLPIVAFGF